MKVVWYTAMSMDGRIASADASLDFLETIDHAGMPSGEFETFLAAIDAVIIGASTMRWLLDGGHGWPHDDLPTWLVTHDTELPARIGDTRAPLQVVSGDLAPVFAAMESARHERVWLCGGGDIAAQALALGRVDEVIATIAPTVLGAGPALFDGANVGANRFELVEARPLGGGAARLVWRRPA